MKYNKILSLAGTALLLAGCNTQPQEKIVYRPIPIQTDNSQPRELVITPNAIPGTPRSQNDADTGGYAPSNVQAQLKIDVKDGTEQVKVVRDNTDPYVITKPYTIKKADPYAVRSYLEAAVGAKSVRTSPAQATAVKFNDGTGLVLVSAEEYRFKDTPKERGIDSIVAALDRSGLRYAPDAGTRIYFPRNSRASTLRDMLIKVGSSELDPEFAISPSTVLVDGELNALLIRAPEWSWNDMRDLLVKYDRPIPEVKVTYRILEIYAENDDRIGVDFQSWKNNDGVDLFSTGAVVRRNWGTFFTSGVQDTGNNRTSYWNFNPKWNTRYLDFMTSIGKAKVLARGIINAQNRMVSNIQVSYGFFYDRTFYEEGASSIAEACTEFTYTNPNPDTIQRESISKIVPIQDLRSFYKDAGSSAILKPIGYTLRMMGTQTTTNTYGDVTNVATQGATSNDPLAIYLTGHANYNAETGGSDKYGTAAWYNNKGTATAEYMNCAPGIIHGWLQYPMVSDGFQFDLNILPVVTSNAAKVSFNLNSISLLGWNADGSTRTSKSAAATTVQIGYEPQEFVIGGLKKSETVRGTAGLPFFKDIPVLGRVFSTETESIKQSQLVLIAKVEYVRPDDFAGADVKEELGKIVKGINKGMTSRVGNMFFQQYGLDDDRAPRNERLDDIGNEIKDESEDVK